MSPLLWIGAALAGDDLSVTSIGADAVRAETIDRQDADLLLAQRLRWEFATGARALVDARFVMDPGAPIFWEESRLRELGVTYASEKATLSVGRHPLTNGGPRLVDGLQALTNVGPAGEFQLGGWAGLVPDEFTTAPTSRVGFGPMVGLTRTAASLTATGDFVFGNGASRYGTLLTGRGELGSTFEANGRLDWLLGDSAGNSGMVDGTVFLQVRPTKPTRVDVFWNGYSSLLYQTQSTLDPTVQRFSTRLEDVGLAAGFTQDQVDPTLHHLFGAGFATHGTGTVQPLVALRARTLAYPDPEERYSRLGGTVGVSGLAGERLELDVDGNLMWNDVGNGGDIGLMALVEPDPHGALAIDASFRALINPGEFLGYPGWYFDLFLDLMSRQGTSAAVGVAWDDQPSDLVGQDVGIAGFFRLQQWVRPGRAPAGAVGSRQDESAHEEYEPLASDSTAGGTDPS